jgi:hypothetical protein
MLDEFDAFARPQRQTLLYALLDALQACQVQVRANQNPNLAPNPPWTHRLPPMIPIAAPLLHFTCPAAAPCHMTERETAISLSHASGA